VRDAKPYLMLTVIGLLFFSQNSAVEQMLTVQEHCSLLLILHRGHVPFVSLPLGPALQIQKDSVAKRTSHWSCVAMCFIQLYNSCPLGLPTSRESKISFDEKL
jgi:hypothetical protein